MSSYFTELHDQVFEDGVILSVLSANPDQAREIRALAEDGRCGMHEAIDAMADFIYFAAHPDEGEVTGIAYARAARAIELLNDMAAAMGKLEGLAEGILWAEKIGEIQRLKGEA